MAHALESVLSSQSSGVAHGPALIPIGLSADLIDGLGDPGIAGQCGEAPGLVIAVDTVLHVKRRI